MAGGGGLLGRVEEGEVAGQDQLGFVGFGVGGLLLHLLRGDGQHAEAVFAEVVDLLDEVADEDGLHREDVAVALEVGASGEHGLRGALGQQAARCPSGALDHDRHHAAGEVEGDFVHLAELVDRERAVQLLVVQHGAVEDVLEAGLEVADEVGILQHRLVSRS